MVFTRQGRAMPMVVRVERAFVAHARMKFESEGWRLARITWSQRGKGKRR